VLIDHGADIGLRRKHTLGENTVRIKLTQTEYVYNVIRLFCFHVILFLVLVAVSELYYMIITQ
jgi:hypothetical protein